MKGVDRSDMKITMTYEIAMAAGKDAGNRHMRKNNRTGWNLDDRNVAAGTFHDLYPDPTEEVNNVVRIGMKKRDLAVGVDL